ncbi:MAG: hypothetical protein ACR2PS_03590 [Pseudomonadales bacterium]
MKKIIVLTAFGLIQVVMTACAAVTNQELVSLENGRLALNFHGDTASLHSVRNKLTDETYLVRGEKFSVVADNFTKTFSDFTLVSTDQEGTTFTAHYQSLPLLADVVWTLGPENHFAEKRVTVTSKVAYGAKRLVVGDMTIGASGLEIVRYGHPDFGWISHYVYAKHGREYTRPLGSEPTKTYFGRTPAGGFFLGLEMPYDDSRLEEKHLTLSYRPSLKVGASEALVSEPLYFGVYEKVDRDKNAASWRPMAAELLVSEAGGSPHGDADSEEQKHKPNTSTMVLPLPSESIAMTAMTSTILGPPRHGLTALACGWHCQMEQEAYDTEEKLVGDLRSLDFLASLGLDGVTDSHPWGGETAKMAGLREGDSYVPGDRVLRFVKHARDLGLIVTQWPTMNNTHPWRSFGGPLRPDKPEWLRGVEGEYVGNAGDRQFQQRRANCLASAPFFEWLQGIAVDDALGTELYKSWTMDGDFWGTGAYFNTTLPVTCLAEDHEHLPGDSNYACQRQLNRLIETVRKRSPDIYILMCRPPMDLGIWAQCNVDACFTFIEIGTGGSNIAGGNESRTASRIRVQHHFFPHWLDQSLLFPSYGNPKEYPDWPSENIDFLMVSAISSSPNLLLYLPTKTGIPATDQAEIRKWLTWGRKNIDYLNVRVDLPDWPRPGHIDGSAHIVGKKGLVFLFNASSMPLVGTFTLSKEIGLIGEGEFQIEQEYPPSNRAVSATYGERAHWEVPAQTAVILRVHPDK